MAWPVKRMYVINSRLLLKNIMRISVIVLRDDDIRHRLRLDEFSTTYFLCSSMTSIISQKVSDEPETPPVIILHAWCTTFFCSKSTFYISMAGILTISNIWAFLKKTFFFCQLRKIFFWFTIIMYIYCQRFVVLRFLRICALLDRAKYP